MKACDLGDALIAIDEFGKGIFQVDKRNMSVRLLRIIDGLGNQRNVYQAAERCNNEIFFFPVIMDAGNDIVVYHLENQQVEYIDLKRINKDVFGDYRPVRRIENSVWLFPTEFTRELVRFQLDTRQIEVVAQWKNTMKNIVLDYADAYAKLRDVVEFQDVLYHVVYRTNYIIGIDKRSFNVKCYTIPADIKFTARMDCRDGKLWIAGWKCQGIVSWEPGTQKIRHYPVMLPEDNTLVNNNWIDHILCGEKYLWLIPRHDKKIIKMCYETGNCEYIDIFSQKFCLREGTQSAFGMIVRNGNTADLYPYFSNIIIHIDLQKDILLENYEYISLPQEWSEEDIINYQLHYEYETNRVSPNVYMNSLLQTMCWEKGEEKNGKAGNNIWKWINDSNMGKGWK